MVGIIRKARDWAGDKIHKARCSFDPENYHPEDLKNAVLNSMKEISQRYDFKGSISKIELENEYLVVNTEDDLKAKQVNDILISNLVKRKIDPKSLKEFKKESASGNSIRILFSLEINFIFFAIP